MSDKSGSIIASADLSKAEPDYFTFYTHEVKELISQNEDVPHVGSKFSGQRCGDVNGNVKTELSGSFFVNSVGSGLSNRKKESLNALLRQSVEELTREVDEIVDPAMSMRKLQLRIRKRKLNSDDTNEKASGGTKNETCSKRAKTITPSSVDTPKPASPRLASNGVKKHCDECSTKTRDSGGKFQCNACRLTAGKEGVSHLATNESNDKGDEEGDDDLQFLLMNDTTLVEEAVKKYSNQLYSTVGHMEKQLEELLDSVVSTCRPMKSAEKQQLKKLIQKLPPENLHRVVEIVERDNLEKTQCSDEVFVDLEQKDNATLWRLYYYTEAVEKAKKLSAPRETN